MSWHVTKRFEDNELQWLYMYLHDMSLAIGTLYDTCTWITIRAMVGNGDDDHNGANIQGCV